MTKLQQEASDYKDGLMFRDTDWDTAVIRAFKAGAQTILENPGDFGLVRQEDVDAGIRLRIDQVKATDELIAKYREALERIANSHSESPGEDGLIEIAIGALK